MHEKLAKMNVDGGHSDLISEFIFRQIAFCLHQSVLSIESPWEYCGVSRATDTGYTRAV